MIVASEPAPDRPSRMSPFASRKSADESQSNDPNQTRLVQTVPPPPNLPASLTDDRAHCLKQSHSFPVFIFLSPIFLSSRSSTI